MWDNRAVWISILLYTRNPYSYSHCEIFICIYSVRGDIDEMSTNTFRYTTCCAANVTVFYILIGIPIAPLIKKNMSLFVSSIFVLLFLYFSLFSLLLTYKIISYSQSPMPYIIGLANWHHCFSLNNMAFDIKEHETLITMPQPRTKTFIHSNITVHVALRAWTLCCCFSLNNIAFHVKRKWNGYEHANDAN